MSASASLIRFVEKIAAEEPVSCAKYLETMNDEDAAGCLMDISLDSSGKIVRHLSSAYTARLLRELPDENFVAVIDELDEQKASEILSEVPENKRKLILSRMDRKKKKIIREYLSFPEGSAGRIMSRELIALRSGTKVSEAVRKIRELTAKGYNAFYVYVIDDENRLIGVMNMRDILLAEDDVILENVMRKNVFALDSFMDREDIARELHSRRFFAAPVIDMEKRLLGVVKSDHIIGQIREEASEDFQKLFGAGGDERVFSPIGFSIQKRLPWLYINLITAFLAASVVALFEDVIAKITILAVFLPVVAGQGGNAGAQSLAVVMRGLVMKEIPQGKVWRLVFKETVLGGIQGLMIGVVTAFVAWVWHGNPFLGLVIGLGMIINLIAAGFSGAAIPLIMKRAGLDPAQSSSIIVTTVTDVVGFFAFLGFAVIFQQYLS
jgi:magnesium transporter